MLLSALHVVERAQCDRMKRRKKKEVVTCLRVLLICVHSTRSRFLLRDERNEGNYNANSVRV